MTISVGAVLFARFELTGLRDPTRVDPSNDAHIVTFDGVDKLTSEPVIVRVFQIPADPTLALLASALWDREVRSAHLATSSPRGKSLLKLLEARKIPEDSALVIISEVTGESLADELRDNPPPEFLRPAGRALFWPAMVELTQGIQALHSAGLIHRAISPAAIFISQAQDRPLLMLGDYSWAVYLHGLSRMAAGGVRPSTPGGSRSSPYTPPESEESEGGRAESFRSDMFSLGVVIAECLLGKLPRREKDPSAWLELLRRRVGDSPNVSQEGALLVHRLLAASPASRPSAADALDMMRLISSSATRSIPAVPDGPLTVVMDMRPQSGLWGDLGKWIATDGIGTSSAEFLEDEFRGAPVFVMGERKGTLWVRGNSGTPYSLGPYRNKKMGQDNNAVAQMWPSRFVPIAEGRPLLTLERGLKLTPFGWQVPTGPTWAPYFAIANAGAEEEQPDSPRAQFVARLRLTLEAEKELLSRSIYAYKTTRPTEFDAGHRVLEVQLDPTAPDPFFDTRERTPVEAWFRTQFADEVPEVELSENPHPAAKLHPRRKWRIQSLLGDGRLLLESPRTGDAPPQSGWVRPWNLKFLLPLLDRKRRTVDSVERDDYLLDAVTDPGKVTIFHGTRKEGDLVSEILGTRPLFLLQGPPGTGKTYWASKVVEALLREDETARVLVSAQAHKPLDHLMERVADGLSRSSLSTAPILLRLSPKFERLDDEAGKPSDLDQVTKDVLRRAAKWSPEVTAWTTLATEWRTMAEEQVSDPSPSWERLLQGSANVVFATSTSSSLRALERTAPFDFVIIEEAGKAYAPELLPPMRLGRRWLLIGDQQQLPPFQHHEMLAAVRRRLERDAEFKEKEEGYRSQFGNALDGELRFFGYLFDRAKRGPYPFKPKTADSPTRRLSEQWRMPSLLSEFISTIFYGDPFKVRTPARPLPFQSPPFLRDSPLVWIATPHCSTADRKAEERAARGGGFTNPFEAMLVDRLLLSLGPSPLPSNRSLAILSPYAAQVQNLKRSLATGYRNVPRFNPQRDVHTVDSFQGREADLVIVSLVRNNDREQLQSALGFLTQEERMNVLLSRASAQLIVIGCLPLLESFSSAPEIGKIGKIASFVRGRGIVVPEGLVLGGGRR